MFTDKYSSFSSSKKLLFSAEEDYYREPQLDKVQRICDGGVLIPKCDINNVLRQ